MTAIIQSIPLHTIVLITLWITVYIIAASFIGRIWALLPLFFIICTSAPQTIATKNPIEIIAITITLLAFKIMTDCIEKPTTAKIIGAGTTFGTAIAITPIIIICIPFIALVSYGNKKLITSILGISFITLYLLYAGIATVKMYPVLPQNSLVINWMNNNIALRPISIFTTIVRDALKQNTPFVTPSIPTLILIGIGIIYWLIRAIKGVIASIAERRLLFIDYLQTHIGECIFAAGAMTALFGQVWLLALVIIILLSSEGIKIWYENDNENLRRNLAVNVTLMQRIALHISIKKILLGMLLSYQLLTYFN